MSKKIIYFSLLSVLLLEMIALYRGINGKALALAMGIFGTIIGYWIHVLKSNRGG